MTWQYHAVSAAAAAAALGLSAARPYLVRVPFGIGTHACFMCSRQPSNVPSAMMTSALDEDAAAAAVAVATNSGDGSKKTNKNGASEPAQPSTRVSLEKMEELFLTMHYRKMQRDLNGPQKKQSKYHYVLLACMLILIYGLSAYQRETTLPEQEGQAEVEQPEEDTPIAIVLTVPQIVLIGVWIFVSVVVTGIFAGSKLIHLLYWMIVYFPLLAMLASVLFYDEPSIFGDGITWIAVALIIVEVITLLAFVLIFYVYPKVVTSKWFRLSYGASRYFRISVLDDWTMEYDGRWGSCSRRYVCRYVGEVNEEGLPHGRGVWSDDSYNGEVLTGMWKDGKPVAPFDSRQYGGKGNTFAGVQLAYYMASDDTFEANKLMPTNEQPPRCGVISVECSIAGDFYSNLPEASLVVGPKVDGEDISIGECCRLLDGPSASAGAGIANEPTTALHITSDDPRGIQVGGHVYAPTGLPFTKRLHQIIISIKQPEYETLERSVDDEGDRPDIDTETESDAGTSTVTGNDTSSCRPTLEVRNWAKIQTRDALIFLPGFNSWLKHSAETLGQMVAMTNLTRHVYPILFSWPGGQVPTYRHASFASATENNRRYFLQMLRGLQQEGIQNIHIVSHSLGVQTLMNAFENQPDGSVSEVSACFRPAPAFTDTAASSAEVGKLVCRTMTMLNPDFPVQAFREAGFKSIRRVCRCITVVGDKNDQALWWSGVINGACNAMKYNPPSVLDSEARRQESGFIFQQPIGRDIESLYADEQSSEDDVISFRHKSNQNDSSGVANGIRDVSLHSTTRKKDGNAIWLDVDVIDTTGLDTNVNDLRHAAFSVNSILLRDIEELVVTGKRASERTTLLHKAGNVYEYCHAPSFVKPE